MLQDLALAAALFGVPLAVATCDKRTPSDCTAALECIDVGCSRFVQDDNYDGFGACVRRECADMNALNDARVYYWACWGRNRTGGTLQCDSVCDDLAMECNG